MTETTGDEVVYARAISDQGPDFAVRYRVIKRTKTRLYVDRQLYHDTSRAEWEAYPEKRQCFTLDRQQFERLGESYSHVMRRHFFASEAQALGDWDDNEVPF